MLDPRRQMDASSSSSSSETLIEDQNLPPYNPPLNPPKRYFVTALHTIAASANTPEPHPAIYASDSSFVVIYDSYPKSSQHLLVIPLNKPPSTLSDSKPSTLRPLLARLRSISNKLCTHLSPETSSLVGFHAIPSLTVSCRNKQK